MIGVASDLQVSIAVSPDFFDGIDRSLRIRITKNADFESAFSFNYIALEPVCHINGISSVQRSRHEPVHPGNNDRR